MADIFISYSSFDHEKAAKLTDQLRAKGFSVWIDETNISAATQWSSEIVRAIEQCSVFIVLLSNHSFGSHNVIKELSLASEEKKHIIPVDLEPVELTHDVKYQLAGIQRVSFKDIDRIVEAAARFLERAPQTEQPVIAATKKRNSKVLPIAIISVVIIALGLGGYFLFFKSPETPVANPAISQIKKIVVLPFESLSPSKEDEFFADGLTAQVINTLSGLSGIEVTDRQTSMTYKGKKNDIKMIAKELGVRYVVDGTVQKNDKSVKITAEMIDVETGKTVMSDKFDGTTDDLFALQEKLARAIVFELQGTLQQQPLLDSTLARQSTKSPEAYTKYVTGAGYLESVQSLDQLMKGLSYLDEAVKLDPDFGYAQFCRGAAHFVKYEAFSHDPSDFAIADSLLILSEKLSPLFAEIHIVHAQVLAEKGDFDGAVAEATKYMQMKPQSTEGYAFIGTLYYERRDFARAASFLERGVQKNIASLSSWSFLIDCYNALGDTVNRNKYIDESEPLYQLFLDKFPSNTSVRLQYALNLANRGKKDEAHTQIDQVVRSGMGTSVDYYNIACTYARLNEPKQAIDNLKICFEKGYNPGARIDTDPDFESIKKLPEFQALTKKMIEASKPSK